jgi:hypothetical protein
MPSVDVAVNGLGIGVPSPPKLAQLVESFGAGLLPFQIAKALASVVPKANKTSAAKPDSLATRSRYLNMGRSL